MEPIVHSNNTGFTLLEVMVAMVIMMVGLLGLLQAVNMSLLHNMSNQLRNDAVQVADEQMALEMTKPFDLISTNTANVKSVPRVVYNATKNYAVTKTGLGVTSNTKSVALVVAWSYKGQAYSHSISSLISKFSQ